MPAKRSTAAWLASLSAAEREAFLDGLSQNALAAMPWLWTFWAHPAHQLPPPDPWRVWVILGGRGSGKTRAGAEWIRSRVEGATPDDPGPARRVALVGETIEEVRRVMVLGESGLLACTPPDRRPEFLSSQNRLVWPNGAEATILSAANPEALRGPQFDTAWADELAKWRRAREAWDMLQFCLRLGEDPRQIVTTTPRDAPVLAEILADPGAVVTRAGTAANAANLAPGFLAALEARYGGTALGRQELGGELIRARRGALWTREVIEAGRVGRAPALDRVVVAVDPPVSAGASSDECGILVAGVKKEGEPRDWRAYVLADYSAARARPGDWAGVAAEAYAVFGADRLVAEVNQGGDLVETVMRQVAPHVSYRAVRAGRSKRLRAEPVAALYEQGRVHHAGAFPELEDQMCSFEGSTRGGGSPDRLDALVWALTDLILGDDAAADPRVRGL
jgi:phage terminase large subunit-like protein